MELIDFVQDRFKKHERTALSQNEPKVGKELQMDWLRSEDLKRGEGGNRLGMRIAGQRMICLIQIDLKTPRTPEIMRFMSKRKTRKESAEATLAEVSKEMAKPRVAMSARESSRTFRSEALVVKNNGKK
jgi:hypothetical protein